MHIIGRFIRSLVDCLFPDLFSVDDGLNDFRSYIGSLFSSSSELYSSSFTSFILELCFIALPFPPFRDVGNFSVFMKFTNACIAPYIYIILYIHENLIQQPHQFHLE